MPEGKPNDIGVSPLNGPMRERKVTTAADVETIVGLHTHPNLIKATSGELLPSLTGRSLNDLHTVVDLTTGAVGSVHQVLPGAATISGINPAGAAFDSARRGWAVRYRAGATFTIDAVAVYSRETIWQTDGENKIIEILSADRQTLLGETGWFTTRLGYSGVDGVGPYFPLLNEVTIAAGDEFYVCCRQEAGQVFQVNESNGIAAPNAQVMGSVVFAVGTPRKIVISNGAGASADFSDTIDGTNLISYDSVGYPHFRLASTGEQWTQILDPTPTAADIAYAGGPGMSAGNVEAAIDELATEKADAAAVTAALALKANITDAVMKALAVAKGDIIVATGPAAFSILSASGVTDGWVVTRDASTATGIKWAAASGGGGGGSGHTIEDSAGTDMTARTNLQFIGANVTDDATNDRTVVTVRGAAADPIVTRVYQSVAQSLANNVDAAITFTSETRDLSGLHDSVTNTTRITIQKSGDYEFIGQIAFAGNVNGNRVAYLRKNGSTLIALDRRRAASPADTTYSPVSSGPLALVAGDYMELIGGQDSGGALNTVPGEAFTWLALISLGGAASPGALTQAKARRTAGNLAYALTTWADVDTALDLVLAASVGDVIEYGLSALWNLENVFAHLDVVTWVGGAAVNSFATQGAVSGTSEGVQAWYGCPNAYGNAAGTTRYVVQAGDIANGTVTLRLRRRNATAATKTLLATANSPLEVFATNLTKSAGGTPATSTLVGAKLTKSAVQSIPASTLTAITWDGEDYDSGSLHDLVTNTQRITITVPGYYLVGHASRLENIADGVLCYSAIRKNGTTIVPGTRHQVDGTAGVGVGYPIFPAAAPVYLVAGDYLEVVVYHESVGARDFGITANGSSFWASQMTTTAVADYPEAWHEIGAAGQPAFENSWVNYPGAGGPYQTAAFYKDRERVYLKGLVDGGAAATTIFTLPAGYRPAAKTLFPQIGYHTGQQLVRVDVLSTGEVQLIGPTSGEYVNLDGISFRAA